MDDFLRSQGFGPYREAIASILNGEAVYNLEEIRRECNFNAASELIGYLDAIPHGDGRDKVFERIIGEYDLVTNAALLENRILLGEDVREVYSIFNEQCTIGMVTARKFSKKCLADFLESI
mgnify:CR=1 FL=1